MTPYAGNEVAAAIGTFTFVIPANSVLDLAGNALATLEATLIVTNLVPVAVNDAYSIAEDGVLTVAARGVLANDTDFDPLTLTAVKVSDPDFGTLVLNSNGSFTYTPDAHFNGTDTFTYKANDGLTDSNIATVTITVTPVNDDPAAEDDAYKTDEDVTLNVSAVEGVLANDGDIDGDNLAAYVLTQPEHGKLTLVPDGSFTYVPNPDWNGVDTFTYQLVATPAINAAWTDEATVTITVNPIDDDPIVTKIGNQDVVVGETVTFTVVATDPEGLALIYSLVDAPIESTISATGEFSWDTTGVEPGDYTFQVCVSDGVNKTCETITVTIAAAPEPQPIKIYLPIIFR